MNKVMEFIRRERLYIFLLTFIILINILIALPGEVKDKVKTRQGPMGVIGTKEGEKIKEELFMKREEVEKILRQKRYLALLFSLTSLLMMLMLFLGILIDSILVSLKLAKRNLEIQTYRAAEIKWNILDVARVVILFLFFGYMVIIIESLLIGTFPILKDDNFRMILNSSILDILTVVFIIYFTVNRYRENLISLGLTVKNFFKNIFYGIVGYIATVPILIGSLLIISLIIHLTKYVPEKQPIVELFMREKDMTFLIYTSVFASIVGPFIEELFFRGFMYNAFKKRIGILGAIGFTSMAFATLHSNVVGFVPILVLGILLTYLYEKTGTLVSSITVHIIHNLSMVYLVFLIKQVRV